MPKARRRSPTSSDHVRNLQKAEQHNTGQDRDFNIAGVLRSRPDFYKKHLKGAPNMKAVKAFMTAGANEPQ